MFRLAHDHRAEHDGEKPAFLSESYTQKLDKPIYQLATQGIWFLQLLVKKPKNYY